MKKSIFMVAVAILGLMATSCNKENEDLVQTPICINANYGNNAKVAYSESGNTISATWEDGDELIVCWNGHKNTLTLTSGEGTQLATFSGSITGTPIANSTLICFVKDKNNPGAVTVLDNGDYLYIDGTFLNQDGTLAGAAKCNLYYGTCFYGDGSNISCTFSVNTSMMKFKAYAPAGISEGTTGATLTYKSGSTELAKATFTVGSNGINNNYLTIPAGHYTGEQTLVYQSGDITENETLSSTQAKFVAGQTYSKTLLFSNTPVVDALEEPLTFETSVPGVTVTFTPGLGMTLPLEYTTDDGITWSTYSEPITLAHIGDKVSFRGNNAAYCNSNYIDEDDESRFSCSNSCYIYGNIMRLINSHDYSTATTMTSENKNAFRGLFRNNPYIYSHPSKKLKLPATTLSEGCYCSLFYGCPLTTPPDLPATSLANNCYQDMFRSCSSLTIAPELPATTLYSCCYKRMFYECSKLTSAPVLPATILADGCYSSMFGYCSNLTNAPSLPATSLADYCYSSMFFYCSKLTSAPSLPATSLADWCYSDMFYGCSHLTHAPELPAMTLSESCYSGMFRGCVRLTTAPVLPATTMALNCYSIMFFECTNLNYVKCLATSGIINDNYYNWLNGVASSGTFIKAAGVNWTTGTGYGIPSGWTVIEE